MFEQKKFRDDSAIPSDFLDKFAEHAKHQTTADEYLIDKYIVETLPCKGPQFQPICLYDFTNKIRLNDILVFKPNVDLATFVIDDYFVYEEPVLAQDNIVNQTIICDLDGLGGTVEHEI